MAKIWTIVSLAIFAIVALIAQPLTTSELAWGSSREQCVLPNQVSNIVAQVITNSPPEYIYTSWDSVTGSLGYFFYIGTNSGIYNQVFLTSTNEYYYSNAVVDVQYYVSVSASNLCGLSQSSNEISVIYCSELSAPQNVTAEPAEYGSSNTVLNIAWIAPANGIATGYNIWYFNGLPTNTELTNEYTFVGSTNSFTIGYSPHESINGTTHYIIVTATNMCSQSNVVYGFTYSF